MKLQAMYQELEGLAERLGITVIQERGDFTGGYCRLSHEELVVLNRSKPLEQRVHVLTMALRVREQARAPNQGTGMAAVYMKPAVRALLEDHTPQTPPAIAGVDSIR